MTESDVQDTLFWYCYKRNHCMIVPNVRMAFYEVDLYSLTQAGYLNEYEIKLSTSDYVSDFKKKSKHRDLRASHLLCNRFWYVTPVDLIGKEWMPEYAGLIETNGSYVEIVKDAPLLHKHKISKIQQIKILNNYSNRNWFKRIERHNDI